MQLSVIIPTLTRQQTALALAARLEDLFQGIALEIILVHPTGSPPLESKGPVRVINDAGKGVYMAYRAGLRYASGEYCWFMGDDDYPLDGAALLRPALLKRQADVLVAPVIFSSGRLYRPVRSLLVLHFFNWCQQGVLYRRTVLSRHRFYRRLPVLADQYVNIKLRCDPDVSIEFFPAPICVFGIHGISGRLPDTGYRSLRMALARRTLSACTFLLFCALLPVEPLIKRIVRYR